VPVELIRDGDDEPVVIRINGHEFACGEETHQTTIPKEYLIGIRLSEIPDDITIKPFESIKDNVIEINHDFELSGFRGGEASAIVEEMFRRKFWDGDVGLTPYVTALREAIDEDEATSETDFEDDGDYIFLHYEVTISQDFEMQDATAFVDGVIERVEDRADQLTHRRRDGLLGIFDRGSFEADLGYALAQKQRVALIMVDIDHFKRVNDTLGHPLGDEVLRRVAKVLSAKSDGKHRVEYRYGGEELSMIVTGGDVERVLELAEEVRLNVEHLRFDLADLVVTISLGVAEAGEDRESGSLVKRADAALYRAKQEGRNRVKRSE
jgi:diguanylate cyclase (GGDEF)-like protein